ncbi:MAG: hypothetical protein FJ139_09885 [Deltaproteobacteria bacterium]|nr:hypothetical protein [Deltaproteobacteria bacterium]
MTWHVHQNIGTEVLSIAGRYVILDEGNMTIEGRDFLFVMGAAIVDSSCCGPGGCQFLSVPGYIVSWKSRVNEDGLFMSEVEPVTDEREQQQIRNLAKTAFPHAQVIF